MCVELWLAKDDVVRRPYARREGRWWCAKREEGKDLGGSKEETMMRLLYTD